MYGWNSHHSWNMYDMFLLIDGTLLSYWTFHSLLNSHYWVLFYGMYLNIVQLSG